MVERLVLLAGVMLGVYVGCMLTEAFVLVPYWRALAPSDFLAWYAANDRRLYGFFGAVTAATLAVMLLGAAAAVWTAMPGRWAMLGAALVYVGIVAMFPLYFEHANASFAAGTIAREMVPAELARWAWWHGVRTAASAVALALAMLAAWRARM
jgi:uncharacterized membrane protein